MKAVKWLTPLILIGKLPDPKPANGYLDFFRGFP
jgi:hypothetical protein